MSTFQGDNRESTTRHALAIMMSLEGASSLVIYSWNALAARKELSRRPRRRSARKA